MVDFVHLDIRDFDDRSDAKVHDGAYWSKIVEGHQRVHLVLGRAQEFLHQDESERFKDDAAKLEQEADEDELNLAERGNDNPDHDEGHLE